MWYDASASEEVITPLDEFHLFKLILWRILPFLLLCYFVAYLDRVNVSFAKLQMAADLHFSDATYGFGAGIFFIAYAIFEVPSNLLLARVGTRVSLARIMIAWGLVSVSMLLVSTPTEFYVARFLLGAAEAGFFPGVLLYLTYWFPASQRGRITALLMSAVPVSGIIGGPLSGFLLEKMKGIYGLAGWQWLFIIEGVPAIFLGIVGYWVLDDNVEQARWLSAPQRSYLQRVLSEEQSEKSAYSFRSALCTACYWQLGLIWFCIAVGTLGIAFWLPTLIMESGVKDGVAIGWLSAIPSACAAIGMVIAGRSGDATRRRRLHVAVPMLIGAAGLVSATIAAPSLPLVMISLTVAATGTMIALPMYWPLPSAFLGGTAAAGGFALLNSLGNVAGFVSPFAIGWIKNVTHSSNLALLAVAGVVTIGAFVTIRLPANEVDR
jgi:MFS family permease